MTSLNVGEMSQLWNFRASAGQFFRQILLFREITSAPLKGSAVPALFTQFSVMMCPFSLISMMPIYFCRHKRGMLNWSCWTWYLSLPAYNPPPERTPWRTRKTRRTRWARRTRDRGGSGGDPDQVRPRRGIAGAEAATRTATTTSPGRTEPTCKKSRDK